MFEKEAEEYYYKTYPVTLNIGEEERKKKVTDIFIKGAEFGYNKAKAEIKLLKETHRQSLKILTDQIEELHKANEWHYVKNEKPKDNEYVLIYTDIKNVYIARLVKDDYFITNKGGFVQTSSVIAWKEIVLPELKENE